MNLVNHKHFTHTDVVSYLHIYRALLIV